MPNKDRPKAEPSAIDFGWKDLIENWQSVVQDLAQFFGIYWQTTELNWLSIADYVNGLLTIPESRIYRMAFTQH